ncbi:MAG: hypothetical protein CMJ57_00650 [Planctomycetaceae bacterium]|nr:hypothetical protein [Planctomycetaceae bacterium]
MRPTTPPDRASAWFPGPTGLRSALLVLVAVAVSAGGGCGQSEQAVAPAPDSGVPRIVSLSPALTQAMIDLGLAHALVGCTPFAPEAANSVPVVGDLLNPDLERILAVDPDLLLVQPTARGVDPALRTLAREQDWDLVDWRIDRLEDVRNILREVPSILGRHGADEQRLQSAVEEWLAQSEAVLTPCPVIRSAGRILVLYGVDPPAGFGTGTYVDDILVRLGGRNALQRPGYPELSLEDLLTLSPDTILVLGDPDRGALLQTRFEPSPASPEVLTVEADALLIPGTRLLEGVRTLRATFGCPPTDIAENGS